MPAIIKSSNMRVTKSNTFRSDEERVMTKKITHLKKEQDRASRDSTNHGSKTKLREEAKKKIVLEDDSLVESEDSEIKRPDQNKRQGVKTERVILKRLKRKPGHRGTGSTERF